MIPLGGLLLITWTYDGRLHERVFVVLCTCPLSCIFDPYVRTPLKMMINTCTIHPAVTMRNVQGGVQYKGLIPPTMMGRTSYFNRTIQSPRMKFANFFAQNQPPCAKPVVVNFLRRGRFRARQLDRVIEIFFRTLTVISQGLSSLLCSEIYYHCTYSILLDLNAFERGPKTHNRSVTVAVEAAYRKLACKYVSCVRVRARESRQGTVTNYISDRGCHHVISCPDEFTSNSKTKIWSRIWVLQK